MAAIVAAAAVTLFIALTFLAWRRYLWAGRRLPDADTCRYSLTDVFGDRPLLNVPHQAGIQWLPQVFSRSAEKFPHLTALQIPHTGESLSFAELDQGAEAIAAAVSTFLTGPDQIVAVAMPQDNWQIVASHLGVLRAGGTLMFIDDTLPEAHITHMLRDAQPVLVLTRGQSRFRDLPTLDVLMLPDTVQSYSGEGYVPDKASFNGGFAGVTASLFLSGFRLEGLFGYGGAGGKGLGAPGPALSLSAG